LRQGGFVKPAQIINRVDPKYPQLAIQTHLSGTVELEGVIGVDGHLRELKILGGHPFFTKAALDAVSRWTYEPTTLNGDPVEVIAPITVTFRLN
jgi:TonB family protein